MSTSEADDPGTMSLMTLRAARKSARRDLELLHMRFRQAAGDADGVFVGLQERVASLTDELIRRYREDLALVDTLLEPAYPRHGRDRVTAPEAANHPGETRRSATGGAA